MLKSLLVKPAALAIFLCSLVVVVSFQNCNQTKFAEMPSVAANSALSTEQCGESRCETDRYVGQQVCTDTEAGPVYGVCVFEACKEPFELINGICQSRICHAGEVQACEFEGSPGLRYCSANAWGSCRWIKATVNGSSVAQLLPGQSYVVEVRSSDPDVFVQSSSFSQLSGTCASTTNSYSPWNMGSTPVALGNNILNYSNAIGETLGGCVWRGGVSANLPGLSSYVDFTAVKPVPNVNCVGAFGQCINEQKIYTITVPQSGTGQQCPYTNGAILPCPPVVVPVNCVGSFGVCVNGEQTFSITTPASGGGVACSYEAGAKRSCGTTCVGNWGTCVNGTQSYTVTTPAAGGGLVCPYANGASRSCGTPCAGSWGTCVNGTQSYAITTAATGGGLSCPFATGATQACGTACVGGFGTCVNGTQTYSISTPAANGGLACAYNAGATQSCGSPCSGQWGTCANGTQSYSITTPATGGGLSCPYNAGATQACGVACVGDFGQCVDGIKTFAITTPASGGGASCAYGNGATQPCSGGIVNCVGSFGTCVNGTKTFHITTPASGGGGACQYAEGATQQCGTPCVGGWGTCANGTQSYSITTPAAGGGLSCPFAQGASQACGTACVGGWGTCVNGSQSYSITTPSAGGGLSCPYSAGATRSCGTACVGGWGSCANGSQSYVITTAATGGGLSCPFASGATQSCGTACVGSWGTCVNGSQSYSITTAASGGGLSCPFSAGASRSCGTPCVGSWGTCSNGSQTYSITQIASGGGATCPFNNGATQSCGVACQGAYGECSKTCGGGVKNFIISVPPSGGGLACPAAQVSCNTQACVCANGAVGSSYPTCNVCPTGQVYYNGKCEVSCSNGAINPPLCNTCQAPAYMNPATNKCTVAVDVQCENNSGEPFFIPYLGLMSPSVSQSCSNGIEVNNLIGGIYEISTSSGAATTVVRDAWIDFATYTAADSITISVVNAAGQATKVFSQCVIRTANYGCAGVTGTPPADSIRQFRLSIPPGTKKIRFDFGNTVSPFYLRMYGLCDFNRAAWSTITSSGGTARTYPEQTKVIGTASIGGACGPGMNEGEPWGGGPNR